MLPMVEDRIQQWDLLDFNPVKGLYTWTNNIVGEEHISARLDRFLVQDTLMMNKKIIITKILLKLTSDHKLVHLILEDEEYLGPIPFQFSPIWIGRDGFIDTVKAAWAKSFTRSSSYVWEQKLKATKQALKNWIKKPAPNPTSQRKEIVQTLEEEYSRIKSRSLWLKVGDRNTSFFHRQYRARLSRNHILEITTVEGQICKGFSQIKEAAERHFKHLYTADTQTNEEETADLLSNIPLLVSTEDNGVLTKPTPKKKS
eukprot:PITA_12047